MPKKGFFLVLLLLGTVVSYADERPIFLIDKGACPFECCTYREWGVEKGTKLYAQPDTNSPVVGIAEKATKVKAQTGEVHTKPGMLIVRQDTNAFQKGAVLWVYTYLGEGFYKIWFQGKFIEEQIDFSTDNSMPSDWGYFEMMPDSVWWVKMQTRDGITGWTNESNNFSNKDACG